MAIIIKVREAPTKVHVEFAMKTTATTTTTNAVEFIDFYEVTYSFII